MAELEDIKKAFEDRDRIIADGALDILNKYLEAYSAVSTQTVVRGAPEVFRARIAQDHTLQKVLVDFWSKHRGAIPHPRVAENPSALLGIASLLTILRYEMMKEIPTLDQSVRSDLEDLA